jgi:repressor of nif and glnA expression
LAVNELQLSVLRVLAETNEDVLTEGEIKGILHRHSALTPTLRALSRRGFVRRGTWWTWQITDEGLIALGLAPHRPRLHVIDGGLV